ncbi:hypothetical protein CspHIS471_0601190 [Cutaneotrichosporon sp. HIS471]|nr:hypothetical protein CspHIS471_0601190 [Cutaneotrichosporon sp. HIS471]
MFFKTAISSLFFAAVVFGATAPKPQARSNADALAHGLPLMKPRLRNDECQERRRTRRALPSGVPGQPSSFAKTCKDTKFDFSTPDAIMTSNCSDTNGVFHTSTVALDRCLSHDPASIYLACYNGAGFVTAGGCVNCAWFTTQFFFCDCDGGKRRFSQLDMCVGNMNVRRKHHPAVDSEVGLLREGPCATQSNRMIGIPLLPNLAPILLCAKAADLILALPRLESQSCKAAETFPPPSGLMLLAAPSTQDLDVLGSRPTWKEGSDIPPVHEGHRVSIANDPREIAHEPCAETRAVRHGLHLHPTAASKEEG